MGRLLKLQLKENLKSLIGIWLIPLVLSAGFIYLNRSFDNIITQMGMSISMFLLFLGLGASSLIVIYLDYQRFFGREAIFYQSLPISSMSSIRSRFLNYLISLIFIFVVMFIDFSIISAAGGEVAFIEIKQVFTSFFQMLGSYPKESSLFLAMFLSSALSSIFMLIFCINFGSQKAFKSMGIFGPIVVFILTNLIIFLLMIFVSYLLNENFAGFFAQYSNIEANSLKEFIKVSGPIFYIGISVNLIMAIIFGFLADRSQGKRLSVG